MAHQALARKWRPKTFSEMVGQGHVVKALSNALEQQRLHHAYLLTGTRGVGKTTLARILAKSLNCETGITPNPCCTCSACREIDSGRFIDLLELDAASNTGIDNMREVLDNAQYAPTAGRFKVYLIDEVHMLSRAAFNSMLKTLEEPPSHVKFILATTDPQKIPVTVLSRCLQFNLKHLPPLEIGAQLQHILQQEEINCEVPALALIARAAQGSMRDALSLLDQAIAYGAGTVEEAEVRDMLGAIDQSYLFSLLEALARQDGAALMDIAEEMETRSLSFDAALQDLGTLLHKLALAQTVPQALAEELPERSRILELATVFTPEEVQLCYQIALHGRRDLGLAPDEFSGFTMTLLRMLAFTCELSGAGTPSQKLPPRQTELASSSIQPLIDAQSKSVLPVATQGSESEFDGDWPKLILRLKLGGMAKMLAQHCELRNHSTGQLDLCVPEEHKHLLEKGFQDKLKAAVNDYFGHPVAIFVSVGAVTGMTPAALHNQEKHQKQQEAVASIEQDPFVRDLVETFDAQIIESTIKPIE